METAPICLRCKVQMAFLRHTTSSQDGAAFSLFPGAFWLFVPVTVVALVMIGYFFRSFRGRGLAIHVVLGTILAGTLGNLTDRVRLGYVVDFISVGIGEWRFPTFNVADSGVTVGAVILAWYLSREESHAPAPPAARDSSSTDSPGSGGTSAGAA